MLGNISQVNAFFEFTSLITEGAIGYSLRNSLHFLKKWKMLVTTKLALIFLKKDTSPKKLINKLIVKYSPLFMASVINDSLKTIVTDRRLIFCDNLFLSLVIKAI